VNVVGFERKKIGKLSYQPREIVRRSGSEAEI
jgi:hypothetical protein